MQVCTDRDTAHSSSLQSWAITEEQLATLHLSSPRKERGTCEHNSPQCAGLVPLGTAGQRSPISRAWRKHTSRVEYVWTHFWDYLLKIFCSINFCKFISLSLAACVSRVFVWSETRDFSILGHRRKFLNLRIQDKTSV